MMGTAHTLYKCPPDCNVACCNYCEGGLAYCTTCGGAEASLPTECPGVKMTDEQEEAVQAGRLDYSRGRWHTQTPRAEYDAAMKALRESRAAKENSV